MDVPAARRVERPTWLNARTVLGLLLFAVALFGGQRVLTTAAQTTPVWTAARDIAPGEELGPGDVRVAEVRLPADLVVAYVSANEPIEGLTSTRAFGAGELIANRWLSDSGGFTGAAMTVPVTPEHAVGGTLRPGDVVDVYATFNAADLRARTELVVGGAEVLDIVDAGGLVVADDSMIGVTLAVDPEVAGTLANAIRTAEVDLVRVSGTGT